MADIVCVALTSLHSTRLCFGAGRRTTETSLFAPTLGLANLTNRKLYVLSVPFNNFLEMTSLEMITTRELGNLELREPAQTVWKPTPAIMVGTSATLKSLVDTLEGPWLHLHGLGRSQIISPWIHLHRTDPCPIVLTSVYCRRSYFGQDGIRHHWLRGKVSRIRSRVWLSQEVPSRRSKRFRCAVRYVRRSTSRGCGYTASGASFQRRSEARLVRPRLVHRASLAVTGLFAMAKHQGRWRQDLGGSCEAFDIRPLPQLLIEYCVGDVGHWGDGIEYGWSYILGVDLVGCLLEDELVDFH
jgi:hypothetical protein